MCPNKNQENTRKKHLSLCRWLYNYFLAERRDLFKEKKIGTSYYKQIKELPKLKQEKPELKEIYVQVFQETAKRVDKAFQNFFQRVKAKKGKAGYPHLFYLAKLVENSAEPRRAETYLLFQ